MDRIVEFWNAVNARDWDAVRELLHPDVVALWPQSRERAMGREAFVAFESAYPGDWTLSLVLAHADVGGGASRIDFTVDGTTVPAATFFGFDSAGRIDSIEEYWPEPYDVPAGGEGRLERY